MPIVAVARAVRGVRQDHELAVAVRQLLIELQQVLVGRVAVVDAADHQHRRLHLLGIDLRQVHRHVEIGAGRHLIAEFHLLGDDRLRHRRVVGRGMAVAGEDRADHGGVALAAVAGAQRLGPLRPPADLRRTGALVGEGDQHQPVDPLGVHLRIGAGADPPRGGAVEMHLGLAGLLQHDRDRGLEVLDAAVDVGIVAGAAGAAVAVVVHGPHVVAVAREHVHERIFALARHGEVVGRARRIRRAVHQEQDRQRLLAGARRADALAPEVEPHAALVRPVLGAPDRAVGRLRRRRAGGLRLRRCQAGHHARPEAEAGPLEDAAARRVGRLGMLGHGLLRWGAESAALLIGSGSSRASPVVLTTLAGAGAGVRPAGPPSPGGAAAVGRSPRAGGGLLLLVAGHRPHARRSCFRWVLQHEHRQHGVARRYERNLQPPNRICLTDRRMEPKSTGRERQVLEMVNAAARFCDEKIGWNRIGFFLSITIIAIAGVALYRILRNIEFREVVEALVTTNPHHIALAALFVAAGYFTLTFYDLFALRTIGRPDVPYWVAALAGFTSYSVGHNVGASVLTGGAVRYRVYSAWRLNAVDVAKICFIAGLTFWLGNATVLGLGIAYEPQAASALNRLAAWFTRGAALAGLIVRGLPAAWMWRHPRVVGRHGWSVTLPGGPLTLLQIGIGIIDLGCCALAMYMLVPDEPNIGFVTVAVIFVAATLLGFASHAPGGLGVFDAAMLVALWQFDKEDLLAGLLLFRLLYYIIPFALSLGILGVRELALAMRGTPPPPAATVPSIAPTEIAPSDAPAEKTEVR